MRIAVVGGIFDTEESYRRTIVSTPETTLVSGLRVRGHDVDAFGHRDRFDLRSYDVVHVHHLARGALRVAGDSGPARLVFTEHAWGASSRVRAVAERIVLRAADGVIALSDAERLRLHRLASGAIEPAVVPNGIDPSMFPFDDPPRGGPWRILFVGQLTRAKGVDSLLRAVAMLRNRRDLVVRFVYHVASREAAFRELAASIGVNDAVEFAGPAAGPQLSAQYRWAHVVCLPSLGEALPSVVTEAMLSGRPVVATDVGGIRDQLPEAFGVLIRPSRDADLVRGLSVVFDDYDAFSARGPEMRRWACEHFSVDAMLDGHERVYLDVVGREGPRRAGRGVSRAGARALSFAVEGGSGLRWRPRRA